MKTAKHYIIGILLIFIASNFLVGCVKQPEPISNLSTTEATIEDTQEELTPEQIEAKIDFANSSAENDTDMGLRNIKIDTAEATLTDNQKMIIRYFDQDYFTIESYDYEFLRRYPQVFDGAQLQIDGTVVKVLSQTADEYEIVLWLGYADFDLPNNNYVVLHGKTGAALFMEGDILYVYGRYQGIETFEIDGTSYTTPRITVHEAGFDANKRFDTASIKTIAHSIFGDNLQLRKPIIGQDIDIDEEWEVEKTYVAELENQSNAKFSSYYLYTSGGEISDATVSYYSNIERHLEFSADFEHFLILTYDWSMETLTIDYYDNELNKVWHRDFEEVTPPETEGLMLTRMYDYTKNNIYCVINNEMYIINTETGEDTFQPIYVGKKLAVRKLNDGILLVGHNKSDGVMKLNLDGSMKWKTNLPGDVLYADQIQVLEDNLVLNMMLMDNSDYYSGTHYIVLDNETGSVVIDAIQQ